MTWAQLEQVLASGCAVGSHTVSHPHLHHLPADAARRELADSRDAIQRHLGIVPRTFCYPYGDWNADVVQLVAHAGYDVACNNIGRREHGRYLLARTNPGYWTPALTPLVRCHPWYFELNRSGLLEMPRKLKQLLRPPRGPQPGLIDAAPGGAK
jgi:peptidoglycan/xylan/chitin deacetylase (PgdA/CDA1 family)